MSLSAATLVGTIANWFLLICLLGGVISTFFIVKSTDVKEEHWDELRRSSTERILDLSRDIEKSKEETERLRAQSEMDRLARVKLEASIAPRRLSSSQKQAFSAALAALGRGGVSVAAAMQNAEAQDLADDIIKAAKTAGWETTYSPMWSSGSAKGCFLVADEAAREKQPHAPEALKSAFEAVGIKLDEVDVASQKDRVGGFGVESGYVYLLIGAKPPASTEP